MSDFYSDPNFRRDIRQEFQPVSGWASLVAVAIVVLMFVILGIFAGPNTQKTTNAPAIETTGSGGSGAR